MNTIIFKKRNHTIIAEDFGDSVKVKGVNGRIAFLDLSDLLGRDGYIISDNGGVI